MINSIGSKIGTTLDGSVRLMTLVVGIGNLGNP